MSVIPNSVAKPTFKPERPLCHRWRLHYPQEQTFKMLSPKVCSRPRAAIDGLTSPSTSIKLLLEILLDVAQFLDRSTDVRTVNDVYLHTFSNSREL